MPKKKSQEEVEETVPEEQDQAEAGETAEEGGVEIGVIDEIASDLSERETAEVIGDQAPQEKVLDFDFSKLTVEQLQALKERLDATPVRQGKKGNNTVTLRRIDGKYVVKVGRARGKWVLDVGLDKKVEKFTIPVHFLDEEQPIDMDYVEFMHSERVPCEVLGIMSKKKEVPEGTVFSQELGTEVEQIVTYIDQVFKLKLPDGEVIELAAENLNL